MCDYYMFGALKEELRGHHIADGAGVETFVRNWLQMQPDSFFDDGIKNFWFEGEMCEQKNRLYRKIRCIQNLIYSTNKCSKTKVRPRNFFQHCFTESQRSPRLTPHEDPLY